MCHTSYSVACKQELHSFPPYLCKPALLTHFPCSWMKSQASPIDFFPLISFKVLKSPVQSKIKTSYSCTIYDFSFSQLEPAFLEA